MLKALSSKVSSVAGAARESQQQQVQWLKLHRGWYKINTDEGQRLHDGIAACGGAIQDDTSRWICGFVKFVRVYSRVCFALGNII
ncbi:hypothetical protein GQ457_07G017250 [Hibiscus cannabinus]